MEKPAIIGGRERDHLDMQIYGFDAGMAPAGKGVIKIELAMKPSYFSKLYDDKTEYNTEKSKIADQVITLLERQFPDLRKDIEVVDVCTLNTWERFMGGTHGWHNFPNKYRKHEILGTAIDILFGQGRMFTLPGLENFFFTGQWLTSTPSLFTNASSGRDVVQKICKQCGIKFEK